MKLDFLSSPPPWRHICPRVVVQAVAVQSSSVLQVRLPTIIIYCAPCLWLPTSILLRAHHLSKLFILRFVIYRLYDWPLVIVSFHVQSVLCPIHKKGDIMVCQNYRGMSTMHIWQNRITNNIKSNQTIFKENKNISQDLY